jgi:uncharacterized protein YlxP (DUF503 family)
MCASALRVELHIPSVHSLKEKRAVLRPLVEGMRKRWSVSIAEVDHHDVWQRAAIGLAMVASDGHHLSRLLDEVRRHLDGQTEVEVMEVTVLSLEEAR